MSSAMLATAPIGVPELTAELRQILLTLISGSENIALGSVPEDYLLAVYSGNIKASEGILAYRALCKLINNAKIFNDPESISTLPQGFIDRTYVVDELMKSARLLREASNEIKLVARRVNYRTMSFGDLISVDMKDEYSLNFEGMSRLLEELPEIYKKVVTYHEDNPWYGAEYFEKAPEALSEFVAFAAWYGELIAWSREQAISS